ncbi:hypothetical protein D3C86_2057480 [compost metagenome]
MKENSKAYALGILFQKDNLRIALFTKESFTKLSLIRLHFMLELFINGQLFNEL